MRPLVQGIELIRIFCALVGAMLLVGWAPAALAAPRVMSIEPDSSGPSASSESFTVTFDQHVTGVDGSDFQPTATGSVTGSVTGVTASNNAVYIVTVGGITGAGTLRLDLKASGTGIMNGFAQSIAGGFTTGGARTITAAAATPVPTLSEWAMILFGGLVAGGGALYLGQRRLVAHRG
jgi:hypothetical protein